MRAATGTTVPSGSAATSPHSPSSQTETETPPASTSTSTRISTLTPPPTSPSLTPTRTSTASAIYSDSSLGPSAYEALLLHSPNLLFHYLTLTQLKQRPSPPPSCTPLLPPGLEPSLVTTSHTHRSGYKPSLASAPPTSPVSKYTEILTNMYPPSLPHPTSSLASANPLPSLLSLPASSSSAFSVDTASVHDEPAHIACQELC